MTDLSALTAAFAQLATATESALAAVSARPPVTIRDYGATEADATAGLRAALASGVAIVPPGTWLADPLLVPPGAVLQGTNGQTYYNATPAMPGLATLSRLRLKPGSTGPLLSPDDSMTKATAVLIRDINLDSNGLAQPAINLPDSAISISRFWRMDRVYVNNVGGVTGSAVYIGNQNTACSMRDCVVFNGMSGRPAGHDGVKWYGSDGRMDNCFIGYFGGTGLYVAGGASDEYLLVTGGGMFTCTTGVVIGGRGAVFEGVSIDHNFEAGVYAAYPAGFTNCWFHTNSRTANNTWSDLRLTGAGAVYNLIACRFTGHGGETANRVKYHIDADAAVILNQFGNHETEAAVTAFTNYPGGV